MVLFSMNLVEQTYQISLAIAQYKPKYSCVKICCGRYISQCCAIKFCFFNGKTTTETYQMMLKSYGNDCINHFNVFLWFKRFKDGRESVKDEP